MEVARSTCCSQKKMPNAPLAQKDGLIRPVCFLSKKKNLVHKRLFQCRRDMFPFFTRFECLQALGMGTVRRTRLPVLWRGKKSGYLQAEYGNSLGPCFWQRPRFVNLCWFLSLFAMEMEKNGWLCQFEILQAHQEPFVRPSSCNKSRNSALEHVGCAFLGPATPLVHLKTSSLMPRMSRWICYPYFAEVGHQTWQGV